MVLAAQIPTIPDQIVREQTFYFGLKVRGFDDGFYGKCTYFYEIQGHYQRRALKREYKKNGGILLIKLIFSSNPGSSTETPSKRHIL